MAKKGGKKSTTTKKPQHKPAAGETQVLGKKHLKSSSGGSRPVLDGGNDQ